MTEENNMERRPAGYWNKDTVIAEAQAVMKKQKWDSFPSMLRLEKTGYVSLARAVATYFPGGIAGLRKELPETPPEQGKDSNLDNLLE